MKAKLLTLYLVNSQVGTARDTSISMRATIASCERIMQIVLIPNAIVLVAFESWLSLLFVPFNNTHSKLRDPEPLTLF